MEQVSMATMAYAPLHAAFERLHPNVVVNKRIGYVGELRDNLLPLVDLNDFIADLRAGDGSELRGDGRSSLPKINAIHSSAALVVNCFAPFRQRIADLVLPTGGPFENLQFEGKCPIGLRGGRPPNLDVLVKDSNGVVAVESKLTEHLSTQRATFSPAYAEQIRDERRNQGYFKEMLRLVHRPDSYVWLNAAQLIKHAFGLANTYRNQEVTLLYLYWEPSNPDTVPLFARHRQEVTEFAERTAGSTPAFMATSYPELWQHWRETKAEAEWLTGHIERLCARYLVKV